MFDILLPVLYGLLAGMLTGVFPGLGAASFLIVAYPLLQQLSILHVFVFYTAMMSSIPYYGSVSAIIYGVAGEITSTPAVQYGHAEFKSGRGAELLGAVATSSLIAALIGMLMFLVAVKYSYFLRYFLDNTPRLLLLLAVIATTIMTAKNKWRGLLIACAGVTVGQVGLNFYTMEYFLSGPLFLASGIPFIPMFMGLIVMPELLSNLRKPCQSNQINMGQLTLGHRFQQLVHNTSFLSMIRGGIVGSVLGLIPSVGTAVSSMVAANLEQKLTKNNFNSVVSAEAANNAAAITVLIPFVILLLPIIASEAVILSLVERRGISILDSHQILTEYIPTLMIVLLSVNIVNWVISGVFYKTVGQFYFQTQHFIYPLLATVCMLIVGYIGYQDHQVILYLSVFAVFLLFGIVLKDYSLRIVFVFSYFLSDSLTEALYHFSLLNF